MKKIQVGNNVSLDFKKSNILLAEFSSNERRAVAPMADGSHKSYAGSSIFRLINTKHETVAMLDPETEKTDLTPLVGMDSPVLVTAQPPTAGKKDYSWKLIQLITINEPSDVIFILGIRDATYNETVELNKLFPKWLENVEKMDKLQVSSTVH